jgi:hypothetical protein
MRHSRSNKLLPVILSLILLSLPIFGQESDPSIVFLPLNTTLAVIDAVPGYELDEATGQVVPVTLYWISNKSAMNIRSVSVIMYDLDKDDREISDSFWSEDLDLGPFETKLLSRTSMILYSSGSGVWTVHTLATDKGIFRADLIVMHDAIFPYYKEKNISVPPMECNGVKMITYDSKGRVKSDLH